MCSPDKDGQGTHALHSLPNEAAGDRLYPRFCRGWSSISSPPPGRRPLGVAALGVRPTRARSPYLDLHRGGDCPCHSPVAGGLAFLWLFTGTRRSAAVPRGLAAAGFRREEPLGEGPAGFPHRGLAPPGLAAGASFLPAGPDGRRRSGAGKFLTAIDAVPAGASALPGSRPGPGARRCDHLPNSRKTYAVFPLSGHSILTRRPAGVKPCTTPPRRLQSGRRPGNAQARCTGTGPGSLVAGTGFEPVTFGS